MSSMLKPLESLLAVLVMMSSITNVCA